MELFNTGEEIAEAIYTAEDAVDRKDAIRVVVAFVLHESNEMTRHTGEGSLAGKVTLSLLILSIKNLTPKKKGGK